MAQLSLLNSFCTGALTRLASPAAPLTAEVADGDALGDADGLADAVADGLAEAAGSARARLAISWAPAAPPAAPAAPAACAEELADALGEAFSVADGLALGEAVDDALAEGAGVATVVFGASSSTSRNRSWAVCPTRFTTCCVPWPGTDTLMTSLPCCTTCAWAKPAP